VDQQDELQDLPTEGIAALTLELMVHNASLSEKKGRSGWLTGKPEVTRRRPGSMA
jgi:hypothetical protein